MQKISFDEGLKQAIISLEQRQIEEEKLFKLQVSVAFESLKPINILQKTLNELITPSDLKDSLVQKA